MLPALRRRVADGLLAVVDATGMFASLAGASIVAFLGKVMLAVVLGAVALGFFLRLVGRRRRAAPVEPPPPDRGRQLACAALAAAETGLLVEAVDLPVRFHQAGFAYWHWALVLLAFGLAYSLQLPWLRAWGRRRVPAASRDLTRT